MLARWLLLLAGLACVTGCIETEQARADMRVRCGPLSALDLRCRCDGEIPVGFRLRSAYLCDSTDPNTEAVHCDIELSESLTSTAAVASVMRALEVALPGQYVNAGALHVKMSPNFRIAFLTNRGAKL